MKIETIKPKEAAIRYGVSYSKILKMCQNRELSCKDVGDSKRSSFLINVEESDRYMNTIAIDVVNKKDILTNESPMNTLISYVEDQSSEIRKKGIKPFRSILSSIQKSHSYRNYPVSIRESICIMLNACIDFEEIIQKSIINFYEGVEKNEEHI